MTDLTTETYQICSSIDGPKTANIRDYFQTNLFSVRHYPVCTCKAYHYGKRTEDFNGIMYPLFCKHLKHVIVNVCGWHEKSNINFVQDEEQRKNMICPKCARKTVWVQAEE